MNVLERLRLERGLTQVALAAASGISEGTISDIERGLVAKPQAPTVAGLARALEMPAHELALALRAAAAPLEPAA